jgi:hypothetical protein
MCFAKRGDDDGDHEVETIERVDEVEVALKVKGERGD